MPGVCLSVCLLAALRKNYWTGLHENFITDVSDLILEVIDPASGSGYMKFMNDSSTFPDSHNLAYIFGESDRIFIKILSVM